jgi:hypothetical protein
MDALTLEKKFVEFMGPGRMKLFRYNLMVNSGRFDLQESLRQYIEDCFKSYMFPAEQMVVGSAFHWDETKEGKLYWGDLEQEWFKTLN